MLGFRAQAASFYFNILTCSRFLRELTHGHRPLYGAYKNFIKPLWKKRIRLACVVRAKLAVTLSSISLQLVGIFLTANYFPQRGLRCEGTCRPSTSWLIADRDGRNSKDNAFLQQPTCRFKLQINPPINDPGLHGVAVWLQPVLMDPTGIPGEGIR